MKRSPLKGLKPESGVNFLCSDASRVKAFYYPLRAWAVVGIVPFACKWSNRFLPNTWTSIFQTRSLWNEFPFEFFREMFLVETVVGSVFLYVNLSSELYEMKLVDEKEAKKCTNERQIVKLKRSCFLLYHVLFLTQCFKYTALNARLNSDLLISSLRLNIIRVNPWVLGRCFLL